MKTKLLQSLILSLAFQPLNAIAADVLPIDFKLEESSVTVRARNEHDNAGTTTKNQLQYNVDVKMQLVLSKDGKWKINSRVKTGSTFDGGWNDAGVGNNTRFGKDIALRHLFLQYQIDKDNQASVGWLPILPNSEVKGVFNFDDDGWIDGARLQSENVAKWANKITVTVGRIDQLTETAALSRGIGTPNVIQVHVQGKLSKRLSYALEGTQFDSSERGSEQYLRAIGEIATEDLVSFVDKVVVEHLLQNSDRPLQGFAVGAKKALGETWSLTAQYSYKGKDVTAYQKYFAPREDFYREGHQVSLVATKKFKNSPLEASVAVGKTVSGNKITNAEGLRAEARLKIKFGGKKK